MSKKLNARLDESFQLETLRKSITGKSSFSIDVSKIAVKNGSIVYREKMNDAVPK